MTTIIEEPRYERGMDMPRYNTDCNRIRFYNATLKFIESDAPNCTAEIYDDFVLVSKLHPRMRGHRCEMIVSPGPAFSSAQFRWAFNPRKDQGTETELYLCLSYVVLCGIARTFMRDENADETVYAHAMRACSYGAPKRLSMDEFMQMLASQMG